MPPAPSQRPRGRRARRAADTTTLPVLEAQGVPRARGPVPAPSSDAPTPSLGRRGRRARLVDFVDYDDATSAAQLPRQATDDRTGAERSISASSPDSAVTASSPLAGGASSEGRAEHADSSDAWATSSDVPGGRAYALRSEDTVTTADAVPMAGTSKPSEPRPARRQTVIRDADGVELGEVTSDEAPTPRPAPRFDGRVLNRRENSRGRIGVLVVWILLALAVAALIFLLATGRIGAEAPTGEIEQMINAAGLSLGYPLES